MLSPCIRHFSCLRQFLVLRAKYLGSSLTLRNGHYPPLSRSVSRNRISSIVNNRTKRELALSEEYSVPEGKEFTAEREMVDELQGRRVRMKTRRAQVINESIVREALEGIGLEQWKGCQIIDMNPGVGIFSKVVHEKVEPSRHILLEPNEAFNKQLEDTLIRNPPVPGSKCKTTLFNLNGYEWGTYDKIIGERLFDPITLPPSQGVNKDILFIANLVLRGLDGERFLTQIIEATIPNQWIHRYGRVRALVWVPDSSKFRFLPRLMKERTRTAVINELCTDTMELAGNRWTPPCAADREVKDAYVNLLKNLSELKKRPKELKADPLPTSTSKSIQIERQNALSKFTLKQQGYSNTPKEQYIGKQLLGELEKLYNAPGHRPWTPELEHPPWVYDHPDSPLRRPPQPVVDLLRPSTTGKKRADGVKTKPEWITPPTTLNKPLTKSLRRLPFPNEFQLVNGYDAWELLEAHKHQKVVLDDMLQKFDDEIGARDALPPPPEEKKLHDINDRKKQWLPLRLSSELGYSVPIFARAGVIFEELKAKHGDDHVALAWLKALGTSKRKRPLLEVLEDEYSGLDILQWHKRTKEPVFTDPADAHPTEPIALLDMTTKVLPEWLSGEGIDPYLRAERWEILNYVMRNCFVLRASPIKEAFKTLAAGVEELALGEESLQGGQKKTRLLACHEWVRLAEKYANWPYRDELDVWEDKIAGPDRDFDKSWVCDLK